MTKPEEYAELPLRRKLQSYTVELRLLPMFLGPGHGGTLSLSPAAARGVQIDAKSGHPAGRLASGTRFSLPRHSYSLHRVA